MNAEIAKVWCDALRSGDYPKGKGALLDQGRYCCLGVLCELHRQATGGGEWREGAMGFNKREPQLYATCSLDGGSDIQLPVLVRDWAGLKVCSPSVTLGLEEIECEPGFVELSRLNDGEWKREHDAYPKPLSFAEIADLIEKNVASL